MPGVVCGVHPWHLNNNKVYFCTVKHLKHWLKIYSLAGHPVEKLNLSKRSYFQNLKLAKGGSRTPAGNPELGMPRLSYGLFLNLTPTKGWGCLNKLELKSHTLAFMLVADLIASAPLIPTHVFLCISIVCLLCLLCIIWTPVNLLTSLDRLRTHCLPLNMSACWIWDGK